MSTTNPTPSPGLSSPDSPSQAALAAAKDIHGPYSHVDVASLSREDREVFDYHENLRLGLAGKIDKHFALITQLAETNGKALARAEAELAECQAELAAVKESLALECSRTTFHKGLGLEALRGRDAAQAREASLAAALEYLKDYVATDEALYRLTVALARHQAAVASSAVDGGITDTQRLEYLIKEEACVLERLDEEEGGEEFEVYRERSLSPVAGGPNPRAAIDTAMKASAESSGGRAGEDMS